MVKGAAEFLDTLHLRTVDWTERRVLFPHYCILTASWILPGTTAMKGERRIDDSRHTEHDVFWAKTKEWEFKRLQGKV